MDNRPTRAFSEWCGAIQSRAHEDALPHQRAAFTRKPGKGCWLVRNLCAEGYIGMYSVLYVCTYTHKKRERWPCLPTKPAVERTRLASPACTKIYFVANAPRKLANNCLARSGCNRWAGIIYGMPHSMKNPCRRGVRISVLTWACHQQQPTWTRPGGCPLSL